MNKLLVLLFIWQSFYFATGDEIIIDLSFFHPGQHKYSVFKKYYDLMDHVTSVDIKNLHNDTGFFLIQVHTYVENITLSKSPDLEQETFVIGTNTGLIWDHIDTSQIFYIFRNSKVELSLKVLIAVSIYDSKDPVPGGCNLSFDTNTAPYQVTEYNDNLITVKCQPASANGVPCDNNTVQLDMYHLFLHEYDNSVDSYFNGIENMLTVESILRHGRKVPDISGPNKYRRLYSSYIGTGEIFAIISNYKNRTAVYVPTVSYGCDILKWQETCIGPVAVHWKFLCAVQLIFGVFICFFGHRFFRLTIYIISFTFGLVVTYLVISMEEYLSITEKTITSFSVGFIYGIVWLLIWRRFGVPCLMVNLAFLLSGFLAASLIFYTVLADISIFSNGINFWMVFLSIMLGCIIISTVNVMFGHIASISFVSAYACVMALNYYLGGNLPYILINTYRRVAVKDFNVAVIAPPIQMLDIIHILLWFVLLLFGVFIQIRHQRGKPPFPPNRRFTDMITSSETRPLIDDIFVPNLYTG